MSIASVDFDERVILSCSNVGYAWYELNQRYEDNDGPACRVGFTIFLNYWTGEEIDVLVAELDDFEPTQLLGDLANDAFVAHHAWEIELEAMHRPLILTLEDEGALRFNPLTILRAS